MKMNLVTQKVNVYTTGHPINENVSNFLVQGFDAERVSVRDARLVDPLQGKQITPLPGISMFYGILRGTGHILKKCDEIGEPYIYVDHSYFSQHRVNVHNINSGYFRMVKNGRYVHDTPDYTSDRFDKLDIDVKDWRTSGEHIVVAPMSSFVAKLNGWNPSQWLETVVQTLREHTDRKIVIKPKDSDVPLAEVLQDAHAFVTFDSHSAIDAVLAGIPAYSMPDSSVAPVANFNLSTIEEPEMPDRQQWLNNLAYMQFTIDEILNGEAKSILQDSEDA